MLDAIFNTLFMWLGETGLHEYMVNSTTAFAACETVHFIGLSILFGALLLIDLRGLGFFKQMSMLTLHKFVPVAILGFALNLATGICFLAYDPANYTDNIAFQFKMILIGLAGLNALAFEFFVFKPMKAGAVMDGKAALMITSAASLLLWSAVLVLGRLIAFA